MRLKRFIVILFTLALLPVAPAFAEPEPDNWIWQATGPVMSGTVTGTLSSSNDVDWYMFYVASQTQMSITIPTTPCGSDLDAYFKSASGTQIRWIEASSTRPVTWTYTTPVGTTQFFLAVDGPCNAYRVDISPAASLIAGPPLVQGSTATGEPNESPDQALGPLLPDAIYTGVRETSNDADYFYFYANAAFAITATPGTDCSGDVQLLDSNRDSITWRETDPNVYSTITYTPTAWSLFYLYLDSDCVQGSYRFSISPTAAIQSGPQPPPPPPPPPALPSPMTGLTHRKTKKTVVVYWPNIQGATTYLVRTIKGKRVSGWASVTSAWKSYKKKSIPRKKGMRVEVMPSNSAGASASQVIRIKR